MIHISVTKTVQARTSRKSGKVSERIKTKRSISESGYKTEYDIGLGTSMNSLTRNPRDHDDDGGGIGWRRSSSQDGLSVFEGLSFVPMLVTIKFLLCGGRRRSPGELPTYRISGFSASAPPIGGANAPNICDAPIDWRLCSPLLSLIFDCPFVYCDLFSKDLTTNGLWLCFVVF